MPARSPTPRLADLLRRTPRRQVPLPPVLERLASFGITTTDVDVARRQRFTNFVCYAVAANAGSHFVINLVYDPAGLIPIHVYNVLVVVAALLVPRLHRFGDTAAATAILSLIAAGNFFVVTALGPESGLHIYFTIVGSILFMYGIENWRGVVAWIALAVILSLISVYLLPEYGVLATDDTALRRMLSGHAILNAIGLNAILVYLALAGLRRAEDDLKQANARAEALIGSMLPEPVAARLRAAPHVRIADRVDNVSVLFADLVGFTSAAHDVSPEAVVAWLDELYRRFDELTEAHGAEKIKTIGDSYMVVAGIHGDADRAAVALACLALALRAAVRSAPALGGRHLAVRIGLHRGSATAGVIGATRIAYDLWGDAVNVASRMESHGAPDEIQASDAFHAVTGPDFIWRRRGDTELKGLGIERTWWLDAERTSKVYESLTIKSP